MRNRGIVLAGLLAASVLAGCGRAGQTVMAPTPSASPLPQGSQPVTPDPAEFTTTIDNPYYPLKQGTERVYRETGDEGDERNVITVTRDTKKIQGIDAVVVHDVLNEPDGTPVEDTWDWYAQDKQGNVWYLGEDVQNFADGKPTDKEGSWEAGVDGAYAGVIMPAHPEVGQVYRQEFYRGHAEDSAKVLGLDESVSVPLGAYDKVRKTSDYTPLKPEVEEKYYAPGVGLVKVVAVAGEKGGAELIEVTNR